MALGQSWAHVTAGQWQELGLLWVPEQLGPGLSAYTCVASGALPQACNSEACDSNWGQWPAGASCQHVKLCTSDRSHSLMWALPVDVHVCGCQTSHGAGWYLAFMAVVATVGCW